MTKLGACLLLVGGTAAVGLLVAPLLVTPWQVASVVTQGSFPDAVATCCAAALALAWGRLLVGTALCLADEISTRGAPHRSGRAGAGSGLLRPAVARRVAGALLGGGLTCLVAHPAAVVHAARSADLPLPTRPLGDRTTAAPAPAARPGPDVAVVRTGDTLWSIAGSRLAATGRPTTDAAVDAAWRRLYARNRSTVGPSPDLIHPGARLRMP
jgi:hypothetical protein